ncbi:MAG: hypothetical protein MUO60_20480 [Clostridiaceae bacterium]|nr:hypothetical protein [Clostridiaceae bacterium]
MGEATIYFNLFTWLGDLYESSEYANTSVQGKEKLISWWIVYLFSPMKHYLFIAKQIVVTDC